MSALLSVQSLTVRTGALELVSKVSFEIEPGARMGLIGESGSGKSMTALAVMGLLPARVHSSGSVLLDGKEVVGAPERTLVPLRGNAAAVVFQEPLTALDPLMKVGRQVAEPLIRRARRNGEKLARREVRREVRRLFEEVSLPEPDRVSHSYPHQLSGGQRQRVALAMALSCRPKLLIADEPTTALDVTIQAEILGLLDRLVRDHGMALLFIGHDLPVVASVVDQMTVLRQGVAVEQGPVGQILREPRHAYTQELVDAARTFDAALEGSA